MAKHSLKGDYILYFDNSLESRIVGTALKKLGFKFTAIPRYSAHRLPILTSVMPGGVFLEGYDDIRRYFLFKLYDDNFVAECSNSVEH
jgi:hypothetical protein